MLNWYIFSGVGVIHQEKSGNPDSFLKIFFQTSPNAQSLQLSPSNPVSAKLALRNNRNALQCRVARWFVFKPKIQIWVHFVGFCNERCWYILWTFGTVRGNLVYFFHFGILYKEKSGNPAAVALPGPKSLQCKACIRDL
jgi:hypothetical protein